MTDETASSTTGATDNVESADRSDNDWGEDNDFVCGDPGRFAGDEGTWEPAFRDAIVHLYKRRFISRAQHAQHWEPLVRNLPLVRADLNNHNLVLEIDTAREVMFKKQAPIEDGAPTLLRDVSYSLEETALLVTLRSLTMNSTDRVTRVDHADLLNTLSEYRPAHVADERAKTEKELRAIKKMLDIGILRRDEAGDGYTVDRVIEAALPYATLVALRETLRAAPDVVVPTDDSDDSDDEKVVR